MTIDREQLKRELRKEIVAELLESQQPSIDERIQNAQTPAELSAIFANDDLTMPEQAAPSMSYAEFQERSAAVENAIASTQDAATLESVMEVLSDEVEALAEAEQFYASQGSDDALSERIANAQSVEELEALTNSDAHQARQAQQGYLAQYRGEGQ